MGNFGRLSWTMYDLALCKTSRASLYGFSSSFAATFVKLFKLAPLDKLLPKSPGSKKLSPEKRDSCRSAMGA